MTRKTLRAFVALIVILALSCAAALASGYITTTGKCNLRSSASLNGSIIRTVPKYTELYYTKTSYDARDVRWFYVNYGGNYGWVSSNYTDLKDEDYSGYVQSNSMPSSGYVTLTGKTNLRTKPTIHSSILLTVPKGKYIHYTDTDFDERNICWVKVRYNGKTGWISTKYTEEYGQWKPGKSGTSGTVEAFASTRIRSSYSTSSSEKGILPAGASAEYLGRKENDKRGVMWYKVKYHGITGWVSSRNTDLYY